MRVLLVMVLAGCLQRGSGLPDDPGGVGMGGSCNIDSQCAGGNVCARNSVCLPSTALRAVRVSWTVSGMPANATTCDPLPDLEIEFDATAPVESPHLAYAPLACSEGVFPIDRMPTAFTSVRIGSHQLGWQTGKIDASTGQAALDLKFARP